MLSKKERKYLELPYIFNKDYSYVLKHRIGAKIRELQNDLDLIIESKEYYRSWLKSIFENFLARLPDDIQEKRVSFEKYHKLEFDYNQLLKSYERYCMEEK